MKCGQRQQVAYSAGCLHGPVPCDWGMVGSCPRWDRHSTKLLAQGSHGQHRRSQEANQRFLCSGPLCLRLPLNLEPESGWWDPGGDGQQGPPRVLFHHLLPHFTQLRCTTTQEIRGFQKRASHTAGCSGTWCFSAHWPVYRWMLHVHIHVCTHVCRCVCVMDNIGRAVKESCSLGVAQGQRALNSLQVPAGL